VLLVHSIKAWEAECKEAVPARCASAKERGKVGRREEVDNQFKKGKGGVGVCVTQRVKVRKFMVYS
jgi:hypothetical protein